MPLQPCQAFGYMHFNLQLRFLHKQGAQFRLLLSMGFGLQVSPWDIGNHFPNVILCCGGSIDFQWSVRQF